MIEFDRYFALTGASLPATRPGDVLPIDLRWESLAATATDYTSSCTWWTPRGIRSPGRISRPGAGLRPPMRGVRAKCWAITWRLRCRLSCRPVKYSVRLGLYTLEDGRLPVMQNGDVVGDFVTVGRFLIGDR
ncbi:MAG: hypothetical protein R2854_10230 [Caldilineaceae bacterium]